MIRMAERPVPIRPLLLLFQRSRTTIGTVFLLEVLTIDTVFVVIPNLVVLVVTVVDPVAVFFAPVAAIRIFAPLLPFAMVPYQGWAQNRAKFLLRIYFFLGILAGSRRSCRPVTIVIELVGDKTLQEAVPKRDIRFFLAQRCYAC
jgi:hypothetical protein